jgi:hypothetical protein
MDEVQVINRGVDTLVLNGYYTDERGKPVKRELDEWLALQLEEWKRVAKGICCRYFNEPVQKYI